MGLRAGQTWGFSPRTVQPVASRIPTKRLINILVPVYHSLRLFYFSTVYLAFILSSFGFSYDSYSAH